MDLVKIGKYIAGKRKELGMTQREVAEKLGMSDKSVSKWERGVCLPDVSVYADLCQILGISMNEFISDEDIARENIVEKSEENIIGVVTDSKHKQTRLKWIIGILLVVFLVILFIVVMTIYRSHKPQNFISPIDKESVEMKTAEMLSGCDGAYIYEYTTTDEYSSLKIFLSEYQSGNPVNKETFELGYNGIGSPEKGNICIVPDFDNFTVKLIIADESSKLSSDIPILDGVPEREYYGRTASDIQGAIDIKYNEEQPLAALIYDNDEMRALSIQDFLDGETEALAMDDYVYYFSFEFCKE